MGLEIGKIEDGVTRALDWVYTGERLPNLMVLSVLVAIAVQACMILDDEKEQPAATPRVVSSE